MLTARVKIRYLMTWSSRNVLPTVRYCCLPFLFFLRLFLKLVRAFHRILKPSLVVGISLMVLFWGEYFVYWQATGDWYSQTEAHQNENPDPSETIRFLLVGDAQLIGDVNEPALASFFTKWDSDQFLFNTYSRAYEIARPDIVIFMGDLFDEGGSASNQSVDGYSRRFRNIFDLNTVHLSPKGNRVEFAAIWGDNDVQDSDFLLPQFYDSYRQKIARTASSLGLDIVELSHCRQFFNGSIVMRHTDPLLADSFDFYDKKCKAREDFFPEKTIARKIDMNIQNSLNPILSLFRPNEEIRMLVSHYPLVGPWSKGIETDRESFATTRLFAPHFVLGAHTHKSVIMWCKNCLKAGDDTFVPDIGIVKVSPGFKPIVLPLPRREKGSLNQPHIIIPTASYRMGVKHSGYGILTVNTVQRTIVFSVFWNPRRYVVLGVYIGLGILIFLRLLAALFVTLEQRKRYGLPPFSVPKASLV